MHPDDVDAGGTSSPSFIERVRSLNALRPRVSSAHRGTNPSEETDENAETGMIDSPHLNLFDQAISGLDHSRPLEDRILILNALSADTDQLSIDALLEIWKHARDLGISGAPLNARNAAFAFLQKLGSHQALSAEDRQALFATCTAPADGSYLEAQVKALRSLVIRDGHIPDLLSIQTVEYLNDALKSQRECLLEARKRSRMQGDKSGGPIPEERAFHKLLDLTSDVVRMNSRAFDGQHTHSIVKQLLHIVERTNSKVDMKRAVTVLLSFIQHLEIPAVHLKQCIELLCATLNAVPDLSKLTWRSLMLLLSSRNGNAVAKTLLDNTILAEQERHSHTACGTFEVLQHLASNKGKGLPMVPLPTLISTLYPVRFAARRPRQQCLRSILALLEDANIVTDVIKSDWEHLIHVILTAAGDGTYQLDEAHPLSFKMLAMLGSHGSQESDQNFATEMVDSLRRIANAFNKLWFKLRRSQRSCVATFYHLLRRVLPTRSFAHLLSQIFSIKIFSLKDSAWKEAQDEVLGLFLLRKDVDWTICCLVLQRMRAALTNVRAPEDGAYFAALVPTLLDDFVFHPYVQVANEMMEFAVAAWRVASPIHFDRCLQQLWPLLATTEVVSTKGNPPPDYFSTGSATSNSVAFQLTGVFMDFLPAHAPNAIVAYQRLIEVARALELPAISRLASMKLMARLRCDIQGHIKIVAEADELGLLSILNPVELTPAPTGQTYPGDRGVINEDSPGSSTHRSSIFGYSASTAGRTGSRALGGQERQSKVPSSWTYTDGPALPQEPSAQPSPVVVLYTKENDENHALGSSDWLLIVIDVLQQCKEWVIYSYVLVHLPSQLSNPMLFSHSTPCIRMLRSVIVSQLLNANFPDPPVDSSTKKSDVAFCLIHSLVMLIGYSAYFARAEQDDIVRALLDAIGKWDKAAKVCMHGLVICCHVIPSSITKALPSILQKMMQIITQSHLAVDILEFLGGLARLPDIYVNFREEEYRVVFAICVRYLEYSREQRLRLVDGSSTGADYSSNRLSGLSTKSSSTVHSTTDVHKDLPQYVFALAYHVMTVWFLSLKLADRSNHVGWITRNLAWTDHHGNERMEEQSQVALDMMHRTAYLDLGETVPTKRFSKSDGTILKKTWLLGLSIVSVETAVGTGLTQLIKRQASGTTYATYQQETAPLPSHHAPLPSDAVSSTHGPEARINIFPNHVFLQLTSTIAPTPAPMEAICLPDDEATKRAISSFDRNDTVDGYKVGVIYIGNGQTEEAEILRNTHGSEAFEDFLRGLGTKVQLKGAAFNTQGLDRDSDLDGTHTYAWRDRVAEIVFHVPTLMPTDTTNDPNCVNKKRHVGNDYVNIIFNDSGLPFKFHTCPSQFNFVNIVVTPDGGSLQPSSSSKPTKSDADRIRLRSDHVTTSPHRMVKKHAYFTVQTVSHETLPQISPTASFKLLPASGLSALVRQLALNSSVFSNVWSNREGGEHVSSWRNRLREIVKLRERFANTGTSASTKYPGAKGLKTYVSGDAFKGRVEMGGLAEEEGILAGLDFSRWAGPNPPMS